MGGVWPYTAAAAEMRGVRARREGMNHCIVEFVGW